MKVLIHRGRSLHVTLPAIVIATLAMFMVVNQTVLIPKTRLFRPRSVAPNIPAMVHTQAVFGNVLELLGYDLFTPVVAPGDRFHIRLYWTLLAKTDVSYSGAVTLTSVDQNQVWGHAESFNVGDGANTQDWPVGAVYVQDEYVFPVSSVAKPFIGIVQVSVFEQGSNPLHYLSFADGKNNYSLTTIHITGDLKTIPDNGLARVSVDFAGAVKLAGYSLSTDQNGKTCLSLRWEPHAPIPDIQVMIHFMDATGITISVADGPPLDGLYPSSDWQSGQTLDDTYCFTQPSSTQSIALALYTLDNGQRLSAVGLNGQALKDSIFSIPVH